MAKKHQDLEPKEAQRKKISDDIEEFLCRGGVIEQIESGVSGVNLTKPLDKSIKLGNSK